MYVAERTETDVLEAIEELTKTYGRDRLTAQEIADYLGCHRSTVVRAVERLEVKKRIRCESGRPNRYILNEKKAYA